MTLPGAESFRSGSELSRELPSNHRFDLIDHVNEGAKLVNDQAHDALSHREAGGSAAALPDRPHRLR